MTALVAHTIFGFVRLGFTRRTATQFRFDPILVIGVDQPAPGFVCDLRELAGRIAKHFGPNVVDDLSDRIEIPRPRTDLSPFDDIAQPAFCHQKCFRRHHGRSGIGRIL